MFNARSPELVNFNMVMYLGTYSALFYFITMLKSTNSGLHYKPFSYYYSYVCTYVLRDGLVIHFWAVIHAGDVIHVLGLVLLVSMWKIHFSCCICDNLTQNCCWLLVLIWNIFGRKFLNVFVFVLFVDIYEELN